MANQLKREIAKVCMDSNWNVMGGFATITLPVIRYHVVHTVATHPNIA